MKYILIGTILATFLHSEHDDREKCEGRAVLLREKGAQVSCVPAPGYWALTTTGSAGVTGIIQAQCPPGQSRATNGFCMPQ